MITASALLTSLTFAVGAVSPVHATTFNAVLEQDSSVQFHYKQMGVTMDGKFTRFKGELNFDTENPATAKASFDVDLSSADTGTSDGDDEIVGKDWFNVSAYPVARFESTDVTVISDTQFDITGILNLKGKTQTVVIPATFTTSGDTGVFEGRFTLKRGDFEIGAGSWSAFDVVANDVDVSVRITASAD